MTATNQNFTPGKHQKASAQKQAEELARLDKIVENSSEKNRNFFIAYLGLLIYVQAIIFSTTDLQLLVSTEGLKLPLVDLTVPLVGFYVVVPIFVIALHFNFLQNLESHHYKLMQWQAAHMGGQVPRKFIYPFLFDYAILEQGSQFQRLVKIANSLLCYNLAPITLGLLLIRFSDRQDWLTTLWHYVAFVFDGWLMWRLKAAMRHHVAQEKKTEKPVQTLLKRFVLASKSGLTFFVGALFSLLVLGETLLTLAIGASPDAVFVEHIQPKIQPLTKINPLNVNNSKGENKWLSRLEQAIANPMEWLLPRIVINPADKVWQPDVRALETSAKLAGYSDWVKYFHEKGTGFRPEPTSLRLIKLREQYLPRAQLGRLLLQGADLSFAQLQGADLFFAHLQGADLVEAQLQGANIFGTQLQGAILDRAKLQGSNLLGAQMDGVILNNTAILHALYIPLASVFGNRGQENLFDAGQPNWEAIEAMVNAIPGENGKKSFLEDIKEAKQQKTSSAYKRLNYQPEAIADAVLTQICESILMADEEQRDVTQSFRRQYQNLQNYFTGWELKTNKEYQDLLTDIDRQLCTLPECDYLRDKIQGLDCKPFLKNTSAKKR